MALATQCPNCRTSFRVVPDQLKLRGGLVRCGACKQVFNGVDHLLPPDEGGAAAPVSAPVSAPAPTPAPLTEQSTTPPAEAAVPAPALEPQPEAPAVTVPPASEADDPLLRMTLMDFRDFARAAEEEKEANGAAGQVSAPEVSEEKASEQLNQDIEDLQTSLRNDPRRAASLSKLEPGQADAEPMEAPEPEFVQLARRRARLDRSIRIGLRAGSILLLAGALAQGAYAFRDQLASAFPETAPLLARACVSLGCSVGLPAQIELVSIESSELQASPAAQNTFVLQTLLRNRSGTAQSWPSLELTLNDGNEKPIARRVIGPRDYLASPQEVSRGLPPNSEHPVRISFELSQLKASGYRLYLFYP